MEFLEIEDKGEKQIVYDVFDLNDLQRDIFQCLENSKLTVQEIADDVGRNRSTVQRSLQEMLDKDLLMREGKTDKTVYYVYTALPMEEIRDITSEALEAWHEKVQQRLD
jgi:predicted transcriptional regulator